MHTYLYLLPVQVQVQIHTHTHTHMIDTDHNFTQCHALSQRMVAIVTGTVLNTSFVNHGNANVGSKTARCYSSTHTQTNISTLTARC